MKSKEELLKEIPITSSTSNKINLAMVEVLIDIRDLLVKTNQNLEDIRDGV